MIKHFVIFYSPGTFVAESTEKPIDSWDVEAARKMANEITERYSATPYGFCFTTRERADNELDSKEVRRSGMYFLNCKIVTLEEVEQHNDPNESILLSNMKCNGYKAVVQATSGWKWTQPLTEGDIVL